MGGGVASVLESVAAGKHSQRTIERVVVIGPDGVRPNCTMDCAIHV